ncbi:hypothetical protein [Pedobacter sp. GR22-6]|uniref:hypothetical protein n=1 Tax=Pedobacter sp. GR22-6 TaxID=3127957 RepID=UPI00307F8C67
MTKYIAKEIIEKYINGTCTAEEKAIVESWHLKELADKSFRAEPGQLETAYAGIWEGISRKKNQEPFRAGAWKKVWVTSNLLRKQQNQQPKTQTNV